jgi:hypothetical protein
LLGVTMTLLATPGGGAVAPGLNCHDTRVLRVSFIKVLKVESVAHLGALS